MENARNEKYEISEMQKSRRCRSLGKIYEARGKLLFMTRALTRRWLDEFFEKYVTVPIIFRYMLDIINFWHF